MNKTLYKLSSKGVEQIWNIEVKNNPPRIIIQHGQLGGKLQTKTDIIKAGKNIGKINETTPLQQAYVEAESRFNKQKDRKGYSETRGQARTLSPMLAHKYKDHKDKIVFPCFTQPKLDGCVSGNTLINTKEFGYKTIKWLVDNQPEAKVLSYNNKTKKFEYKKILYFFKNHKIYENVQWYEIELETGEKITITGNHFVYMPELDCWRRVDELQIGQNLMVI